MKEMKPSDDVDRSSCIANTEIIMIRAKYPGIFVLMLKLSYIEASVRPVKKSR